MSGERVIKPAFAIDHCQFPLLAFETIPSLAPSIAARSQPGAANAVMFFLMHGARLLAAGESLPVTILTMDHCQTAQLDQDLSSKPRFHVRRRSGPHGVPWRG